MRLRQIIDALLDVHMNFVYWLIGMAVDALNPICQILP